jgi:thiol-disulfide isomerase/thioredoxin
VTRRLSISLRRAAQHLAISGVVFLAVLLLWDATHSSNGVANAVGRGSSPAAPAFAFRRLAGAGTVRLSSYAGKVVVLAFWASWCEPCKSELPELEKLSRHYRLGPVVVVGLDVHDSESDARAFVRKRRLTFPIAIDRSEQAVTAYGVQALPELFIVSPTGYVVEHFRGLISPAEIERVVLQHM